MMFIYNVDYRKIFVLAALIVAFYWLVIPNKPSEEMKKLPSIMVDRKQREQEKTQANEIHSRSENKPSKFQSNSLQEKISKLNRIHASALQDRDEIITSLRRENTEQKQAASQKDGKLSQLEVKLRKISKSAEDKDMAIKKLTLELNRKDSVVSNVGTKTPFNGLKLVHFDLKGAPPKVEYLIEVMRLSKKFGANGFLIEYEDMFPWSDDLKILAHRDAYTKDDIQHILKVASKEKMEVIPLVQSFGHLEFVLKHERFAHLQAVKTVTTSICPLHNESAILIKKLIDQLLSLHPHSKWIHLGGDEVWNIKNCDRCKSGNYTDVDLYLRHMLPIIKYAKSKLPVSKSKEQVSPIIWDDMMRYWEVSDLNKMSEDVQVMVWGYVSNLQTYAKFSPGMWDRYMTAFPTIWFASSFKGALQPWSNVVPIKQHLDNHLSWLKIYKHYQDKKKAVVGIALTGWSRFDHYGPLCELLPAGIPSLALCLTILKTGAFDDSVHSEVSDALGFEKKFVIEIPSFRHYQPETATFVGHEIFKLMGTLENALSWKDWSMVRLYGWARPYFIEKHHISMYHMKTSLELDSLEQSSKFLRSLKADVLRTLEKIFNEDIVTEWIQDKIVYLLNEIKLKQAEIQKLLKTLN